MPAIQHNDQSHIIFDKKCKAFLQAMYSKQDYINHSQDSRYQSSNQIWSNFTETELQYAIKNSNFNKASKSTELSFLIIEKAY